MPLTLTVNNVVIFFCFSYSLQYRVIIQCVDVILLRVSSVYNCLSTNVLHSFNFCVNLRIVLFLFIFRKFANSLFLRKFANSLFLRFAYSFIFV